jgi:hypothetical protein
MLQAERVAQTPAAKEAALLAPQAHAHAMKLGERAEAAFQAGDLAGSQILGEHSIAAMARAVVLTRLVKAQTRIDNASAQLASAQQHLAKLDEQAQRITSEADNLELRVKVLRDAEPLAATTPASPEREVARKSAARALVSQARLLCMATHLLEPKRATLDRLFGKLDDMDQALATTAIADLPAATRARSDCLRELTLVRRPKLLSAPADGVTDALLEQLTRTERFYAFRDDRGVVVVLRNVIDKDNQPTKAGAEELAALARVAKAHPDFPVLAVTHSRLPAGRQRDAEVQAVVDSLLKHGAPSVEGHAAGNAQPVAPPKRADAEDRNERVEIVFVSPAP